MRSGAPLHAHSAAPARRGPCAGPAATPGAHSGACLRCAADMLPAVAIAATSFARATGKLNERITGPDCFLTANELGVRPIFYLPQAAAIWIAAIWLIEWKRLRQLLVYGLYASFLCAVQDQLGLMHHLWEYRDSGPVNAHTEISILIGLSAAPLFGIYFVQGLKPGAPAPWLRIAAITGVAMIPETVGLYTGNIIYGNWWSYGWSVFAHVILWLSFWGLHRWLTKT